MAKKSVTPDEVTTSLLESKEELENVAPVEDTKIKVLVEAIGQTYNKTDIQLKSDLNKGQVLAFAKNKAFARRYRCPILDEIANNIMENSLSLNRGSRKEFTKIVTASLQSVISDEMNMSPSIPERLFKGR